ncbi:MAG: DedA family protein [Solirubrobacteraceae bacterium]
MRVAVGPARLLWISGLAGGLHLHHHFHGPAIDYVGLALAAFASWAGVPGPGEPVLIAAGVFAARHKLDVSSVLLVAWLGATAGGIAGWLMGIRAGHVLLSARGPLRRIRRRAIARSDQVFHRYAVLAILLAPSWVSGIHRVRAMLYLPVNAAGAALWASGIGLGAYWIGPAVVDFVGDLGLVTALTLGVVIAAAVGTGILRRRRHTSAQRK